MTSATCGPVRRLRLEPAFHEVGPAARALRRSGGDGRPAAAHAADSRFPHDARHLAAADLGRIPAPCRRSGARPAAPVHGHEEIGMDPEDASRLVAMRLTGPDPDMRQPRGVMNPQSGEAANAPRTGPTLKRSLNSSMQAAINAVSGRAVPRKKPTPSSISRSPASIARPRPADPSTPLSRPRPTAWPPSRPWHPSCRANGAASPARPRIPGDLFDRLGLRRIRAARLGQQPDGLRLDLRRVSRAFCHGSIIFHRVRGNTEQKSVHISP